MQHFLRAKYPEWFKIAKKFLSQDDTKQTSHLNQRATNLSWIFSQRKPDLCDFLENRLPRTRRLFF